MDYDTYGSGAVELAIDLANADLDAVETFLTAHEEWFSPGTPLTLSSAEAGRAASTARLVRAVAEAETEDDVLARLNELLALARPRPYATHHDGELHLHYARPESPAREPLTTTVAIGLPQVFVPVGWRRLGVCSAEVSADVDVDTSRNASRRYCSNTCASRSPVAAYRARQKS